uniref:Uncharacterized protein n=1 Tax=Branchiostoma floridae TaxID=7739 RepID=C3ZKV2_BRAFL|eukprot:XP_002590842.1 hypothetical protein BRAFLDRAFT_125716 [Branchiostoma floridae]
MATNGDILQFCGQHKRLKVREKMELLKETFTSIDSRVGTKVLWSSISRLAGKRKKLSKDKKELKSLLNQTFNSPKQNQTPQSRAPWTPRKKKLAKHLEEARKANKHLKKKLGSAEEWKNNMQCVQTELETLISEYTAAVQECDKITEDTEEKMKLMNNNNGELEKYIKEIENAFDSQSKKLQDATEKLSKWNVRNFNKREKSKKKKISICEEKLKHQDTLIAEMMARIKDLEVTNKKLTTEKVHLQKKASTLKAKLKMESPQAIVCANTEKIDKLEQEKCELEEENTMLEDTVKAMKTLETKHDKGYTNQIREVVIDLLSKNVSVKHVSSVIRTVLEKLAKMNITGHLPSETLIRTLAVEGRMLSVIQAGKAMLEGHATLHNDGSTQEKKKFNTTSVTTPSGTLSLGLYEMAEENAQAVFEGNKQTLKEVAEILAKFDSTDPEMELTNLLSMITSTMSDRGSVMKAFNSAFEEWRGEIIKDTSSSVEKVNNFYCYMHVLINMASVALDALKCFDVCAIEKKGMPTKNGRAVTEDALYAACRTFQKQCDERTGQAAAFQAFLYGKDPGRKCQFSKLIGNRCNIQFVNGAAFFFHLEDMREFLEIWKGGGTLSMSHSCLQQHLSNKVAIAGCRALGILEKRVTTPMWREILAATSILDLNRQSLTMRAEFLRLSEDASELLVPDNKTIFPGREVVDEDDVCHALLKDSEDAELDALTISALELIFSSWVILIEKQLTDYLPGGMYDNPDENLKQKSKHVPTTNVTCERSIGYRNRLHQLKPSAKTLHIESLLLLSTNHTVDWLGKLSEDDKERALETARKAAPGCIKKQKEREQEILSHRLELLRQKQDEKERKIRRVSQEKSKICEAVRQDGGEWKTPEEVEQRLCECATDSKKKEKILAQLRFHKVVLEDPLPTDKRYLVQQQMTVNGSVKKFSMSELKENLLELIGMNTLRCNNNNEEDEDEDSDQEVEQGTKYMATDRRLELIQAEKAKLKKKRDKQRERL